MVLFRFACVAWLLVFVAAAIAPGAEFFVSPEGTPQGNGSREKPWDLATALAHPDSLKPGDTLWLRGGVYRGGFASRLAGEKDAPITLRQFPGERATIDCREESKSALFVVDGDWCVYWGFEMTCSDPDRVSATPGFGDLNRGGVHCRAGHVKFINLVIHDTGGAFGFWSEGEGGEIAGCILYNNGWQGPDRGHGHAIYAQNRMGTKRLVENIMFNQFAYGIHVYGSERAFLEGFHIEGNVSFNNGGIVNPDDRAPNIQVGGGAPAKRIAVVENFTYHSVPATHMRLGSGNENEDLTLERNLIAGYSHLQSWKTITATGNQFSGIDSLVTLELPAGAGLSNIRFSDNRYDSVRQKYTPLIFRRGSEVIAATWEQWRKAGFDQDGAYREGELSETQVFVRPNPYERGRAHIIVYNWDGRETIEADVSKVLPAGAKYRLVDAQNFYGASILEGAYDGQPLRIPMQPRRAPPPIGKKDFEPPAIGPEFGVFVLLGELADSSP
jgi:hypothetical protein